MGCYGCFRGLVVFFNFIFVLLGMAVLAVALYVYFGFIKDLGGSQTANNMNYLLYTLMAVGGLTILVGTFGCCGAYHESECLLGAYFLCLLLIFSCEVALGVVGFIKSSDIKDHLNKALKDEVDAYGANQSSQSMKPVDYVQKFFKCCGISGTSDYKVSLPKSCCEEAVQQCDSSSAYKVGCKDKYDSTMKSNILYISIAILSVAVIEFFGLVISMALCCHLRSVHANYDGVHQDARA